MRSVLWIPSGRQLSQFAARFPHKQRNRHSVIEGHTMNHLSRLRFLVSLSIGITAIATSGESIKGTRSLTQVAPKIIPSLAALPTVDPSSLTGDGRLTGPELHEVDEEEFEKWKERPLPEYDGKGKLTFDASPSLLNRAPEGNAQLFAAPTISVNFEGNLQGPSRPGDLMVAVGPDHVLSVSNSTVRVRSKAGAALQTVGANTFLGLPLFSPSDFFDPKAAYDVVSGRFLVLYDFVTGGSAGYYLAVSQTSNAMGGWYVYYFDMKLDGGTPTNNWADYPGLGFTDDLIVMTGNMYTLPTSTATFQYVKTRVVSKANLYSGSLVSYSDIIDVPGTGSHFTLKPAMSLSPTNTQYLLINPSGGGSALQLYRITGDVGSPVLEKIGHLSVSSHGVPPDAQQKDCPETPLEGNDARTQDPVWRDGYLYAVHHVGVTMGGGPVSAIKYYKVNTSVPSIVVDETYGAPATFYSFPAVTVDAAGATYYSFTRVLSTEYAAACITGRRRFDTQMQASAVLRSGSGAYWCTFAEPRWGDYEGVAIDPADSTGNKGSAWANGNWAKGLTSWGSWVGKISYNYHQIQGHVLHDCDSSAATNGDRLPVSLAVVSLYRDSVLMGTDTSDVAGFYNFGFLDDGDYEIELAIPPGSWSVDAVPGSGGTSETKQSSTRIAIQLTGAASASQASVNNEFLIILPHAVPAISNITPNSYSVGEPGFTLTVNGSDFLPCSVVRVDGSDRVTTYVGPGQLQATVLAADIASVGNRSITVSNPPPSGGESNAVTLTVHPPAPIIGVSPLSISFGATLLGTSLTDTVEVENDGTADLVISSLTADDPQFSVAPSGATIPRQTSQNFVVTFSPSTVGPSTANLSITHNAAGSPSSVDLNGIGLDSLSFRTATANDWANAVDAKNKHKAYSRKPDKVFFKIAATSPANPALCSILELTFGFEVNQLRAYTSLAKTDTVPYSFLTSDVKKKIWKFQFSPPVSPATTIQIQGVGAKGKQVTAKYVWADGTFSLKKKGTVPDDSTQFVLNQPGLPRPNLLNVADELFPKGFGNPSPYFSETAPLIVGIPQGTKGAMSVRLVKSANVLKSLIDVKTTQKHTQGPSCLNVFADGKPISSQQSSLSPLKKNNKLFAELLTLKLNMAASATAKFPVGLGELTFSDPSDPSNSFNGQVVKDIAKLGDSLLSCQTLSSITPSPSLVEMFEVLQLINGAFADAGIQKDTVSFQTKTRLPGVRPISDVAFLHITPGMPAESFPTLDIVNMDIPTIYALHQNYPNPFNPTTTIHFDLPEPALVTMQVYDVMGREVATLIEGEEYDFGQQSVEFNGEDVASGVYFYRLLAAGLGEDDVPSDGPTFVSIKKMLLVK